MRPIGHRRGATKPSAVVASAALAWSGWACAGAPPPATEAGRTGADTLARPTAVPAPTTGPANATGFLDRDDVTVRLAGSGLIIDVVPMNADVVSLATDDLQVYLQEALKKVPDTVPPDVRQRGTYFLIGFSATEKEIPFEPTQVHVDSEGRRYYPLYIVPVSAGFDRRVLEILAAPVWAVYIYEPGIDLLSTLEFSYRDELSTRGDWRRVVEKLEEARGRAKL